MRLAGYLLGLAVLFGSAATAHAEDAPQVVQFTLDNGLEVLLAPDHKVPKVGLTLVYRVGGMNEPPGRSGFAHLFEHLMFSGTPEYPQFDDTYLQLGIDNNAFTENDRTTFIEGGLASALPVMLSVEADRMANLGADVTQAELDLQRNVVKNEIRQKVLDTPGQRGAIALRAALFPKPHPYAEATIGSTADLDAATLDDVRNFFARYYVPNNATLAISGDFEVAAVKTMLEETFGAVPRGREVAVPVAELPAPARVRIETTDRVVTPIVTLALAGPAIGSKQSAALGLASDLLGNPDYGVLRRALVNSGLATSASADWDANRLGGQFTVAATAAEGVTAEAVEAALREAVAQFVASEVEAQDVERARSNVLLARRVSTEALLPRAHALAERYDLFGAKSYGLTDDPVMAGITRDDVQAVARALLKPDDFSVLTIAPGAPGAVPTVLDESTGVPEPIVVAERPAVAVPKLKAGKPGRAELPARESGTLSNGIELVHYQVAGSPMTYVVATFSGGFGSDTPGKEGLIELSGSMLSMGAGSRDNEAFSKAARDIGASVSASADVARSAVVLAVPPDKFAAGMSLMADAILRPRFDPEEWQLLRARVVQGLAYRKMSGAAVGYYALQEKVFPVPPGRGALDPEPKAVAALTLEEAKATYARLFTPRTMTIYSVGPEGIDSVQPELETAFGGWKSESEGIPELRHPPAVVPDGLHVHVKPFEAEAQAVIYLARPAPAVRCRSPPAPQSRSSSSWA
jgi:predicted Zn-dependent peptidase